MKYVVPTLYLFFIASFFLVPEYTHAQNKISRAEYITQYKNDAVRDMQRTGVPASITIAQALLESNDGNSALAKEANNHFGVKCADWTGDKYFQDDDHKDECFRKYKNVLESYDDHSNFLRTRPRYASLFALQPTDYKGWAYGLKSAGYATNPKYAEILIKIIEDNQLYELDRGNDIKLPPPPVASNDKPARRVSRPAPDIIFPYGKQHEVLVNNGVSYVIAKSNDSYRTIAEEFEMNVWQIYKYNDLDKSAPLKEGQKIYIKPKKREGKISFVIVSEGQTLHDIAQEYGVKIKLLRKWNHFDKNTEVSPGQKILLRKS